jgi:hypothetical protein
MMELQNIAYAQARVQARFARLPSEGEWQRLAASRTLAAFLEDARTGVLRVWIKGFSGQSDTHDLEVGVRGLYREAVDEVASWVPRSWRDAVSWTRWLILLPLVERTRNGGAMPHWVSRDPWLRTLLGDDGSLDRERMSAAGGDSLLGAELDPLAVWTIHWRRQWPRSTGRSRANLEKLAELVQVHVAGFQRLTTDTAWSARQRLREELRLGFHQRMLQPAVPFIYLALVALDLERLRAALVTRVLFAGTEAT